VTDHAVDYLAPCDQPTCDRLARWRATSTTQPRATCDCDTTPARRWADSDGRTVL
jgi:hypothetical protein